MALNHQVSDQRSVAGRHISGYVVLLLDFIKVVGFNDAGLKAIGREVLGPVLAATAIGALVNGDGLTCLSTLGLRNR